MVSTVARNSGNCNLIGCVVCYEYTCNYNLIIVISISLWCLRRNKISILMDKKWNIGFGKKRTYNVPTTPKNANHTSRDWPNPLTSFYGYEYH